MIPEIKDEHQGKDVRISVKVRNANILRRMEGGWHLFYYASFKGIIRLTPVPFWARFRA